ncbi:hypothetical protein GGI43DRAFT_379454 [Trichoderma evansii]
MRLKSDYQLSQGKNGKQQTIGLQKNLATTDRLQSGTTSILSNMAETATSLQWPPLEIFIDDHFNIPNSVLYRVPEATRGDKQGGGAEDKSMTAQKLQVPAALDFTLEAPNTASEVGMVSYFDYPPDALPQNMHLPSQPISTFQECWDKGEQANQLTRLHTKFLPQTSDVQHAEFDFNDPFWTNVFGSSSDSALKGDT